MEAQVLLLMAHWYLMVVVFLMALWWDLPVLLVIDYKVPQQGHVRTTDNGLQVFPDASVGSHINTILFFSKMYSATNIHFCNNKETDRLL